MPSRTRGHHGGVRRVPPPSEEQVQALAQAMAQRSPVLGAFTLVAAWSGLRLECEIGRLCAEDVEIDPVAGVYLHVRRGKGERERRSVLFTPGIVALRQHGHLWGHVFRNQLGHPWTRKSIHWHWTRARATVGLQHVVFHDLRKFHATWLLNRGVSDLDVAIQLGHFNRFGQPDPELVRRVYGWPDPMLGLARVAAVGGRSVAA